MNVNKIISDRINPGKYINWRDMPYIVMAILLGFLNHFLYRLSGGSALAALFCPVNESVWEHLKLLFFPILFVSAAEYLRYRPAPARFFYYRFLAALCAMGITVVLFYTYTGIIGRNFLLVDILIFLFSILSAFFIDAYFCRRHMPEASQAATFSLWILVSLCYFVFTCFPPDIPLFFSAHNKKNVSENVVCLQYITIRSNELQPFIAGNTVISRHPHSYIAGNTVISRHPTLKSVHAQ